MSLSLQPLTDRHLAGMAELVADADSVRFTRIPEPPPPGFAAGWLERYRAGQPDESRDGFAIEDAAGAFLGVALAPQIDREGRQVELGYLVVPSARGRGVASQALGLLTRWAFEELGMLRAYLLIDVENVASSRVAQRCGYVREGVMRSWHLKPGRRIDCGLWSRLPTDPAPA
ncbi:MAG TPA: GNAT family N-acetyltransferase [Capillimicrobium sp.]|nr:GNAT family N-acetyltransferase [Capillimicrobium sp.]